MTLPDPPQPPRTEAGRRLLDGFAPLPLPEAQELHRRSAMGRRVKVAAGILAIETEAAGAALAALRAQVMQVIDDLPRWDAGHGTEHDGKVGMNECNWDMLRHRMEVLLSGAAPAAGEK